MGYHGVGEYFGFQAGLGAALPPQAAVNGLGAVLMQPGYRDSTMRRRRIEEPAPGVPSIFSVVSPVTGLGRVNDEGAGIAIGGALVITGLLLVAVAAGGYFAGKAMAPRPQSRVAYGVAGSVLGLIGGPIGLGVLGAVALGSK